MIFNWDGSTPTERDAYIAITVLGWTALEGPDAVQSFEGGSGQVPSPRDPERWHSKKIFVKDGQRMACAECGTLPEFSASDAEAISKVLPKLTEHGRLAIDCGPKDTKIFCFGDIYRLSEGTTIAEAICKAAIEVYEKKLKKEVKS